MFSFADEYSFLPHVLMDCVCFSPLPSDHVFLCFAPSLVAAACVAASRLILHLSPTWPPRLQHLTGYTWDNLVSCAEKLLLYVSVLIKIKYCSHQCQSVKGVEFGESHADRCNAHRHSLHSKNRISQKYTSVLC